VIKRNTLLRRSTNRISTIDFPTILRTSYTSKS